MLGDVIKKIVVVGFIFAHCLLLTSCSISNDNVSIESESPVDTSQIISEEEKPKPPAVIVSEIIPQPATDNILNYEEFLKLLEANGFTYKQKSELKKFLSVSAKCILVGYEELYVYEYESNESMENDSITIGISGYSIDKQNSDGTTLSTQISWVSTPHWFKSDLIIALYIGENKLIIDFLNETFGDTFAGGDIRERSWTRGLL